MLDGKESKLERQLEPLVSALRLLSDKTRLNILFLLSNGERNVTSICEALDLPQPTVSHHLGLLRSQNLIANRRDGKQVFYALDGHVEPVDAAGFEVRINGFTVRIGGVQSS